MRKCITDIFDMLQNGYDNRFYVSEMKIKMWAHMLKGNTDEEIMCAVYDYCSKNDWPPVISRVRTIIAELRNGIDLNLCHHEAWGNVMIKIGDPAKKLTALETKCLKQTSADMHRLRTGIVPVDSTRRAFIEIFKASVDKHRNDVLTLPEVKKMGVKMLEGGTK